MPTPEPTLKTELLPHQQRVVDRIQRPDQPGLVVAHGLGSGKTLTSIAAQDALKMPSTVVAPASLLGNYKKEQAKHLQGPRPETRLQSTQLAARRGEVAPNPLLIVDEAHRLRDTSTASYQAVANNQADKRLLLTGSPFYNHPSDISPLINLAAGEQVLPADRAAFEKRYITEKRVDPSLWGRIVRGETGGGVPELNQARAQELRQTFGKWVDHHPGSTENFPEVTHQTIQVPMEQDQLGTYDTLLGRAPPWVAAKVRSGLPPSKSEAQQLNSFLTGVRQVANTTAPFQQEGGQSPKIQRAFQELQQTLGSNERAKAVVYSNYLDAGLSPYKQHLQDAKIPYGEFTGELPSDARNQLVKDYNDNKLRVLLLSSAGGEGLDLKGTRLLQVLEPHWNSEKLKQVEGRGARYKSHEGLPPEEQKLLVQHFLSTRPASGILERLNVRKSGHSVDEYLDTMSKNKEHLIDQFKGLLPQEKTAFKLQGHIDHQGLNIAVENRKGSVRSGVDKDGKPWRTVMKAPYGFLVGTKGADGDEVDVYVGPDKKALNAYVVHQHKSDGTGYDEDKVMLGFPSRAAAEKAYLAHYNDPKFLGPISEVPMEKLKGLVEEGKQMKKISMDAFFSELAKIGAISDEQARGSLERLDTLERNKPTMGQVGRYAGLGAMTAPAMGMIGNAIRSGGRALVEGGTVKDKLRNVAADAAKGAVGMGAMPLLRSHLDRRAEIGTLKSYMQQPHELPSASPGPPGTEVMGKVAAGKGTPQKAQHEQPGWGQAAAGMVGGTALGAANMGLGAHLMKQVAGHPEDTDLFNKVRGDAKVPIHESGAGGMPGFVAPQWNGPETQQNIMTAHGLPNTHVGPEGAVLLPKGSGSPSSLGHELGHADIHGSRAGRALQNGATVRLGNLSGGIGTITGGLSGMSDNQNIQRLGLAAPALAALPQLAFEGLASYGAIKRMRTAGASPAQMGRAVKTLLPAWGTYATRAGVGVANAAVTQGAVSGIRHAGDHEKTAFSPMSELKLMGNGVRKAAVGARDFLATPTRGLPSALGSPVRTKSVPVDRGGFADITLPAKAPNMGKLLAPGAKEKDIIPRGVELLTGKRLHELREGEQYWGGRAQNELGQAPSMIDGMFDPTVSLENLQGRAQGLQSAKSRSASMQARAAPFSNQIGSEANAVAGSRLLAGAGVAGAYGSLLHSNHQSRAERHKKRSVR